MTDVFLKLLNMSFTASFLIVTVLILRLVLKKAPKQAICLLWGLVAIRLICPFSIESVLSLIPSANPIPAEIEYMQTPAIQSGVVIIDNAVNPVIAESFTPENTVSINPLQIWIFVAAVVWAVGLAVMVLYAGISYFLLYRRVRASIKVEDRIYICDDIETPFILGVVRPGIYLPSGMDEETCKYVIAHEQAHLKRLDHWWKPLGFLLLSVYWFNPLIWIAYVMLCRDIELACDEKVVKDMGAEDKKEYSRALLSCNVSRKMIAACPLAFGEVGVKERVKSVLNYKKPSFWIILAVLVVIVGVVVFFMTNPATEREKEETPQEEFIDSSEDVSETENVNETDEADTTDSVGTADDDYKVIYDKYMDVSQLEIREGVGTANFTVEDRQFVCEDSSLNELEYLIYNYYYFETFGEFDKLKDLIGEDEALQISVQNEQEAFEEGDYMLEYRIHGLYTLTSEDMQNINIRDFTKEYIRRSIEEHDITEYALVKVDISWTHNAKSLSMGPQIGDGRHTRYYMVATTQNVDDYKIYDVYWEVFDQKEIVTPKPDIQQVMDRILAAVPLEEATPLTTTADLPLGDQLYLLDITESGKYALYGFHSDEYGYTGLLINYKINGQDNWNYLGDIDNWIGYEFPSIAEAEDGGLFLTYCYMGGSGVHMDRFFYFKAYETGTLERYEFTHEMLLDQAKDLVSFKLGADKEEVQIYDKEGGKKELFALMPYTYAMNGQTPVIKGVWCESEQMQFLVDPALFIVGVGIEVEDSLLPVHIGRLAFQIHVEQGGTGVNLKLRNVSTYNDEVIVDLPLKHEVDSEEAAVALVTEQLILAYENVYGPYEPSDIEPGLYSDDASRLAYIIPRLSVSVETEEYYVIPVIWDFRVYKESGEVTVYYNGVDAFEYIFDPTNPNHIAFAG